MDPGREDHGFHSVQNLIDKLRDLAATKFQDAGGGTQVFDATVTSNDGKRVEKVTINKQGDQYLAKRENEPSIYVLDSKAAEDLMKAAARREGSRACQACCTG